jgi:hypothetical protein
MESRNSFWIPAAYSCQHILDWKITMYGTEGKIHLRKFSHLKLDAHKLPYNLFPKIFSVKANYIKCAPMAFLERHY